ncbi:ABC transporter [Catenovulum agarivorans DS-2]|uniref:ABC transporter n=1 Tax=Catenovulum agarivorans DS-2 TaxID=1328313 RepID=W7QGN9_9ALTE|nr:ABC transporter ATP-binding protein [Catenovulum agarivorans]EWH12099.1 ABC transporter [Catenovulum agarivorans DS-2]
MLRLCNINKRFALKDAKQSNALCASDSRVSGRFFYALKDINMHCQSGQVVALLGANGAGKTTLLRILSTALKADSGEIYIHEQSVEENLAQYRKSIGFLSGSTGLYARLTGFENLKYFAQLYGLQTADIEPRIDFLVKQLAMTSFIHRRFDDYSTGMKQKVAIARAVLHQPKWVILDEPTTGLDIKAREVILSFIEKLKQQGVGVIFSTHDLSEVERLCEQVFVIDQGQVQFSGELQQLVAQGNGNLYQSVLSYMEQSA